jgi:hypothetical protein
MSFFQTTVSFASRKGIPGQIQDISEAYIVSAVATTTIQPGTYVELSLAADGETFLANKPSSTLGTLGFGGVAVYFPTTDPSVLPALGTTSDITGTGYQIGDTVPVLRRGQVFVSLDAATTAGTITTLSTNANVQHPSSAAASATNTGGFFTSVTANTTAATETTAAPGCYFVRVVAAGLGLLTVNMPKTA